jgi:hypothetical protein
MRKESRLKIIKENFFGTNTTSRLLTVGRRYCMHIALAQYDNMLAGYPEVMQVSPIGAAMNMTVDVASPLGIALMAIGCVAAQSQMEVVGLPVRSYSKISYCGFKVAIGSPFMFTQTSDAGSPLMGGFIRSFYFVGSVPAMAYYSAAVINEPRRRKVDKQSVSALASVMEVGTNNIQFDVSSN